MATHAEQSRVADLERSAADPLEASARAWSAVMALSLCVATLIASEFLPISLLTPIATDLHLTQGAAGQAISVSGLFAVLTSLAIATATRGLDRRLLILGLTIAMLVSGLLVAFAPNYPVFLIGRALIGVAIGGFWSMSTAIVMRLVPAEGVPRALAVLNGGNALATTIAAPLGSFLGQYIGWRGAFFMVVPLAALTFVWQWLTLPPMPSQRGLRAAGPFGLLGQRMIMWGMASVALLFMGQFALFTYLRPFLEQAVGLGVTQLSLVLLMMGGAGLLGTWTIGRLVSRNLAGTLIAAPLCMAAIAIVLILLRAWPLATAGLLFLWGSIGTALPVAWWTWMSRVLPRDAEAGGGLMVAVIQFAITLGAGGGGLLYDRGGHPAAFGAAAMLLTASGLVAMLGVRATLKVIGRAHVA
jgi:predicted MFS family arabinose efflux permease